MIAGELEPTQGQIECIGTVAYCPQRTDDPPAPWHDFMEATDQRACMWRGRLQIEADWCHRWTTLSHGQRKRAQIATALWQPVHVLALDEPTNHLDLPSVKALETALAKTHWTIEEVESDSDIRKTLLFLRAFESKAMP